ncbi:hypothetical protein Tco_1173863 [Tanacetum coccineum]
MMKESHLKEIKTTKMAKAKENVLNLEIQIISLESVQNYQETTIKEPSLEDHEVIATKTKKKGQRTKNISWLKHLISFDLEELFTHKEEMDLETAQITTTTKLPTLKQGEYDMWRLRIEQYFQVQDYALWDIIENENSFKPATKTTTNVDEPQLP